MARRFRSVVVITFASHAKGPRFETGRKHYSFSHIVLGLKELYMALFLHGPTVKAPFMCASSKFPRNTSILPTWSFGNYYCHFFYPK